MEGRDSTRNEEEEAVYSLPPFLEKLQHLVANCDPKYGHWAEDGMEYVVCSNEFEAKVLKNYFKGCLKTFIRQLHFYCFKKSEAIGETWSFSHPKFQRDRPDLVRQIKRKTRLQINSFATKTEVEELRQVVSSLKSSFNSEMASVNSQLNNIFQMLTEIQRQPNPIVQMQPSPGMAPAMNTAGPGFIYPNGQMSGFPGGMMYYPVPIANGGENYVGEASKSRRDKRSRRKKLKRKRRENLEESTQGMSSSPNECLPLDDYSYRRFGPQSSSMSTCQGPPSGPR